LGQGIGGEAAGQHERLAILDMIARATNKTQEAYQHPGNCIDVDDAGYFMIFHMFVFSWFLCSLVVFVVETFPRVAFLG